jgi:hypothetical protein
LRYLALWECAALQARCITLQSRVKKLGAKYSTVFLNSIAMQLVLRILTVLNFLISDDVIMGINTVKVYVAGLINSVVCESNVLLNL